MPLPKSPLQTPQRKMIRMISVFRVYRTHSEKELDFLRGEVRSLNSMLVAYGNGRLDAGGGGPAFASLSEGSASLSSSGIYLSGANPQSGSSSSSTNSSSSSSSSSSIGSAATFDSSVKDALETVEARHEVQRRRWQEQERALHTKINVRLATPSCTHTTPIVNKPYQKPPLFLSENRRSTAR